MTRLKICKSIEVGEVEIEEELSNFYQWNTVRMNIVIKPGIRILYI